VLFIDSREPLAVQEAVKAAVPDSDVVKLDSADFLVFDQGGKGIGIERKTTKDFLASLGDNRLLTQVSRMDDAYDLRFILVEGTFKIGPDKKTLLANGRTTGWRYGNVVGKLLSLILKHNFHILHTNGLPETVDTLRIIHQRALRGSF
jgi:ERCC4-type nuclease